MAVNESGLKCDWMGVRQRAQKKGGNVKWTGKAKRKKNKSLSRKDLNTQQLGIINIFVHFN